MSHTWPRLILKTYHAITRAKNPHVLLGQFDDERIVSNVELEERLFTVAAHDRRV